MHHEFESLPDPDPDAVARAGAAFVAERARDAVAASGSFHFAVSGGHTPWAMFAELAAETVPWDGSSSIRWTSGWLHPMTPIGTSSISPRPALARARQLLWLVTGSDKKDPLARLLADDTTIPAGRVEAAASLVMADRAAT